ncbi:4'-phosphopantetheinyl transferase family protein [Budvicia diplopodorum]|uniref:4'-phosphopantetheinyl transferase family protein n=1 Tax=Budvicia diplopodorum TaxID=1119056 RepID=UPI001356EF61|nr:4'-phosphopantetheinyl transferase superfamily protein [Budvicia diplopodorum]
MLSSSPLPKIAVALLRLPSDGWLPPSASRLPQALQQQAEGFNPKRRQQFLTGRWLLAELLFNQVGCTELPDIDTTDNGRPVFTDSNLPDFNISHSGEYIMAALARDCRLGLDVEHIRPRNKLMALAQYSFSDEEYQWLAAQPEPQQTDRFWQLWTLRESTLKLAAKGVWQMKQIRIDPQNKWLSADFQPTLFGFTCRRDDIAWAITSDSPVDNVELWQAHGEAPYLTLADVPCIDRFRTP